MSGMIYKPVLSVKPPWAWLLLEPGCKPVENRTWKISLRGRVWIHAGLKWDQEGWNWIIGHRPELITDSQKVRCLSESQSQRGGIVGSVEIVDCVTKMDSPWFAGPFGFVCAKPERIKMVPCRGALGFFEVKL